MTRRFGLSKSRIAAFEQCSKRLWLSVHRSELAQQDEGAEARFTVGHEVGAIACALLPDGLMVEVEPDQSASIATTQTLLNGEHYRPIFEATLEHDGVRPYRRARVVKQKLDAAASCREPGQHNSAARRKSTICRTPHETHGYS